MQIMHNIYYINLDFLVIYYPLFRILSTSIKLTVFSYSQVDYSRNIVENKTLIKIKY